MRILFKLLLVYTILAAAGLAQMSTNADPDAVKFVTSDIDLFWKAYDKATAENAEKIY